MRKSADQLDRVLKSPALVSIITLACVMSLFWLTHKPGEINVSSPVFWFISFAASLLIGLYIYSFRVRVENIVLRRLFRDFFEINQIYRIALSERFLWTSNNDSVEAILKREAETLQAVCQRTSKIFERITSRSCVVTVKLIVDDQIARTYVRSETLSARDIGGISMFKVGNGANTALDFALTGRKDGTPSHFFSADLRLEPDSYRNERREFLSFYQSTLVVPLYSTYVAPGEEIQKTDVIGFLCLDTGSVNRLNNGYHLYILAALGNQMYN
jgi:hypothetical protein